MTDEKTNEKTSALAVVPVQQAAIEPRDMGELKSLADDAAKSGFYGAKTQEQALMILMAGRDLGLSYTQSLRAFHVIEVPGQPVKLSLSSAAQVAVCQRRRDVCEFFEVVESTDKLCTVETKRVGRPARRLTFTIEDAQRAELTGNKNWRKHPRPMLLARAQAELARSVYHDVLLGLYDEDEIREIIESDAARGPRQPNRLDVTILRESAPQLTEHAAEPFEVESPEVNLFRADLRACSTAEEADAVAMRIKRASLSVQDTKLLREIFAEVKRKMLPRPGPAVSPEPTPERGDAYEEPAHADA